MAHFARRALDQLIVLREGESRSVVLMFAYSFLAMTSYNILKPITRSKFITELRRRQPAVGHARRRDCSSAC